MNLRHVLCPAVVLAGLWTLTPGAQAQFPVQPAPVQQMPVVQTPESQTITSAIDVLQGFTQFHAQSIPHSMMADAQAIAIIPNVVKGGFVVAGRFGRGVVIIREQNGTWRAPTFITFGGGSVGWQVGLQSSDVVLVFKNRKGLETMLSGREFTLGADASIAAGPVGRQASAGTDIKLNAEIYSYSRSRGLFAGVALDGSVLKVDNRATAAYYGPGQVIPPQAVQLLEMVARDTSPMPPPVNPSVIDPNSLGPVQPAVPGVPVEQLQQQLADAAQKMDGLLDPSWKKFLALPATVAASQPADHGEMVTTLARYDQIAQNPKYRALTDRAEFRNTHDLLRKYVAATTAPAAPGLDQLPPPPPAAGGSANAGTLRLQ